MHKFTLFFSFLTSRIKFSAYSTSTVVIFSFFLYVLSSRPFCLITSHLLLGHISCHSFNALLSFNRSISCNSTLFLFIGYVCIYSKVNLRSKMMQLPEWNGDCYICSYWITTRRMKCVHRKWCTRKFN